ncbi:GGDEF domain-containing protein [Roseibium aggregatum]|uniref:diguanylate cyclase n=1 Tax=Roseibium aggregatum TaxID=187304 RepID=A0A926S590_9HYPH|nr:GGDEF domain-containing protein [Roseibium aggregatum]MBD1545890.1 GGDEF domain-containing protein [Roseibium aggregatum]
MYLDVYTLFFLLGTVMFLVGIALLAVWWPSRSEPGLLYWAVSFFVRLPAIPLLMARGQIADRLSIDLANGFLLAGLGLGWVGTRMFARRRVNIVVAVAPMAIWFAACQVPSIYDEIGYRLFVYSALTAAYSFAIAFEFWRDAVLSGHRLKKWLAALFVVNGSVHLLRAVYGLVTYDSAGLLQRHGYLSMSVFVPLVLVVIGTMIAMAMYREEHLDTLKHDAAHDPLTNVLNRRAFLARAENVLREGLQDGVTVALLMLDLDHFKKVNDSHGHLAGDQVLKQVCARVTGMIRRTDLFGRMGGEEFAALLKVVAPDDAMLVAEKIRKAVRSMAIATDEGDLSVTVSIGVAEQMDDLYGFDEMMRRADAALYAAKLGGRDRVCDYSEGQGHPVPGNTGPVPAVEMVSSPDR